MTFAKDAAHPPDPPADRPQAGSPRLAIVEDDDELRDRIMVPALADAGFDAIGLASALQLYRLWTHAPCDLVLLDVGLPDDDGVEIARHLRTLSPGLGIVMYTGHGRTADRVRGLRAGIDAYLVKPVDMEEVIETLRNVHARCGKQPAPAAPPGAWSLDRKGWSLVTPSGTQLPLGQAERTLMKLLMDRPGEPVARDALIHQLASDDDPFDPHRLDVMVYRLRRKCLEKTGDTLPLQAVRGVGYLFGP